MIISLHHFFKHKFPLDPIRKKTQKSPEHGTKNPTSKNVGLNEDFMLGIFLLIASRTKKHVLFYGEFV